MLTFVHLSDIHFRSRDSGTQMDVDQHIRRELLDDLASKPANGANYDGLLITGDIAYSGKPEEYVEAKKFLDEVYTRTGLSASQTFVVPGNHDVDRAYVAPSLPLWSSHEALRKMTAAIDWRENLATQLHKDPHQTLLSPLHNYNYFAQGFDCATTAKNLAWTRVFPVTLEDGTVVRFHGLNSALVSDEADRPSALLVSEFQTAHFAHVPEVIDVVLCHHPPDWLMDKAQIREVLNAFARVSLFGHEHTTRYVLEKKQAQLFAGAVQPAARDPGWIPTYHILQLSVEGSGDKRDLIVRIRTREFSTAKNYRFLPRRNEVDQDVEEHRIRLAGWTKGVVRSEKTVETSVTTELGINIAAAEPLTPTPLQIAQRDLLVHFFRLGTPLRYRTALEANLLRDGDDTMEPQVMWQEVFQRAITEDRLAAFWSTVAQHVPDWREKPNPFTT